MIISTDNNKISFDSAKGKDKSTFTIHQGTNFEYDPFTEKCKVPEPKRQATIKCSVCGIQGTVYIYKESNDRRDCPECHGELIEIDILD